VLVHVLKLMRLQPLSEGLAVGVMIFRNVVSPVGSKPKKNAIIKREILRNASELREDCLAMAFREGHRLWQG
jgi:hypothetical protein